MRTTIPKYLKKCILFLHKNPAKIYLFKVNNMFKVNNKSTKTISSGVFIINFENVLNLFLVFLSLTLNKYRLKSWISSTKYVRKILEKIILFTVKNPHDVHDRIKGYMLVFRKILCRYFLDIPYFFFLF